MTLQMSHPRLRLARLPGEHGPILRCSGELSAAAASTLGGELALALPAGHSVLLLNLSECSSVDVEGLLTILDAFKRLVPRRAPPGPGSGDTESIASALYHRDCPGCSHFSE
jgi:hypothetical protein